MVHTLSYSPSPQVLVDRRGRSVAAKEGGGGGGGGGEEEEEGGASQAQQATAAADAAAGEEEEERILGEFTTETAEIMEELDGVIADGQGSE